LDSRHYGENFANLENDVVTVSQVSAVCRVVLLYEARVTNSLLGNFNFGIGLQCRALPDLGKIFGARSQAPTYQSSLGRTL